MSEGQREIEQLTQLTQLVEKVQLANKEASDIWQQLDAAKIYKLFKTFKEMCPDCDSLKEAFEFYIYLPDDLKEVADKLRRLNQLYMSGYLNLDIDMLYKSVVLEEEESPKPFRDFWSIIFLLVMKNLL